MAGAQEQISRDGKRPPRMSRIGLAALILAAAVLIIFVVSGAQKHLSLENLLTQRQTLLASVAAHRLPALVFYALIYVAAASLSVPGAAVLTVSGGFLFGSIVGGALAAVSATTGAAILFLIARSSIGAFLKVRISPWLGRLEAGFRSDQISYLLFLRLVPFPFWIVNIAAAVLGADLKTFVWTTFAGILPATYAFALAGAGLDSMFAEQIKTFDTCIAAGGGPCALQFSLSAFMTSEIFFALIALGCVALLPMILKTARRARHG